jgi:hypothetical protein
MEDRDRMTDLKLAIFLADEFHDWIDGDDPVEEYKSFTDADYTRNIWVKFESGAQFVINIKEVYE